jgi:hypothetical protein
MKQDPWTQSGRASMTVARRDPMKSGVKSDNEDDEVDMSTVRAGQAR